MNKKLGYYECGNVEFDSKIKALLHSKQTGLEVKWCFNDKEYYAYDWSVEPELSLDQLYDIRTRELREKYDYIMLNYSGGSDSHNILMSFIRQNLHIDEIVVNTMEKGSKSYTTLNTNVTHSTNSNAEHELQCVPRLKEISQLIPKTKITVTDMTDYFLEQLEKSNDSSWVLDKREGLNPAGMIRFNYLHNDEIRRQFDKDLSMGVILGVEKPKATIFKDRFYLNISDRTTNMLQTVENQYTGYRNSTVEYFYWSPEALDIQCKQAHIVKRWLEANPQYQQYWNSTDPNLFEKMRLYQEPLLRDVIYTTWNTQWYQADKSTRDWYSEFDHWFIDGYKDTKAGNIWLEGVNYLSKELNEWAKFDSNGIVDGLRINSRNHYIGKMKPTLI